MVDRILLFLWLMLIADRRAALLAWREMQKRGRDAVKLLMLSVRRDDNVHVELVADRCFFARCVHGRQTDRLTDRSSQSAAQYCVAAPCNAFQVPTHVESAYDTI